MFTAYIIRHPQATGNLVRRFQGHTDTELTDEGLAQADNLAEYFKDIPLDIVFSSDLKRAAFTAAKIANGRETIITPVLREINAGVWENGEISTFAESHPEEYYIWDNEPERFSIERGESMAEVYARVSSFFSEIAEKYDGKTAAIVSHGCAIRNLLCFIKYGDIKRLREIEWSKNAAISYVTYENGVFDIKKMNDESHLEV
jgi:broad specificity phosphatase PhoE